MNTTSNTAGGRPYTVRFFKRLCGGAGRESRAFQGAVQVPEARSRGSAIDQARKEFARRRRLPGFIVHTFETDVLDETTGNRKSA